MSIEDQELELYVVMNSDNKFMRAKGYGGGGDSWVTSLDKARIYTKLKTAKSQTTFWANAYPQYPAPKIVKLIAKVSEIVNQEDRIKEANRKKKIRIAKQRINNQKIRIETAREKLEKAQKQLDEAMKMELR